MTIDFIPMLLPALYCLGFAYAAWAILYAPSPQGAIAWAFFLVAFPYIAIPCYWVFGPRKFYSYRRLLKDAENTHRKAINVVVKDLEPFSIDLPAEYKDVQKVFENLAEWPFTRANSLKLLIDGEQTFSTMFQAIGGARNYVLLQFYIVREDDLGMELEKLLTQKVKEGVKVYFIIDQIGSLALSQNYIRRLRHAGIDVEIFRTTKFFLNRFKLNFRNHRKVVVVDGEVAYTGGQNIGVEYLGKDASMGNWRDTAIEVRGPAVKGVQRTFAQDWYWCTEQLLDLGWEVSATEDDVAALSVPMGAIREPDAGTLFFLQCIALAKKRVWISSPYFVPDAAIIYALQLSSMRGIDVRLIVPAKGDNPVVHLAGYSFLEEIANYQVQIYCFEEGFLHQKVVLVDDEWASIGTANLDNRSLRLNFEVMIMSYNRAFAADVERMLLQDMSKSKRLTSEALSSRNVIRRFSSKFCRLFAPVL